MVEFLKDENGDQAVQTDIPDVKYFAKAMIKEVYTWIRKRTAGEVQRLLDSDLDELLDSEGNKAYPGGGSLSHWQLLSEWTLDASPKRVSQHFIDIAHDEELEEFVEKSLQIFLKLSGYKAPDVQETRVLWVSNQKPKSGQPSV